MASDPRQVQAVFLRAVERAPAERPALLDGACGGDAELRRRVETLLRAHDAPGGFLDRPMAAALGGPADETPGAAIGPYRLRKEIGAGGMGVVWLAEQERPVRRPVALKVIKAGMDSQAVLARFEQERQALALMDHPYIARILDAGATESGRPYFVMELVEGLPITRYCDEQRLTPRQRLGLFVDVCKAVQHAHQKGVIHRDLKPSNVLVTSHDGVPVPKVIDFGVAKATGRQLTERTPVTEFGAVVGTPEYMSPEQAELGNQDIDTRSDIYSLGVLLYELLTGTTPIDRAWLKETPLLDVLRAVREEDTVRPSARLSTVADLAAVAARRRTEPRRLTALVRGELDWVVMKCLEKDRTRRYETASALAADVQLYLDDEPVLACPPRAGYRLRKWAWRHRTGVWATVVSTAAVLLVALLMLALSHARIGRALRDEAQAREAEQQQRERAEANWATALLALADRDWVRGDTAAARRSLDLCPVSHRNEEWRQLHLACHAEVTTIRNPVSLIGSNLNPRYAPDGKGFVVVGIRQVGWFDGDDGRFRILSEVPRLVDWTTLVVGADGAELTITVARRHQAYHNGKLLATTCTVGVWDPRGRRWLVETPAGSSKKRSVAVRLSPDGRLAATAEDEAVTVREVRTGKVRGALPIPTAVLRGFSPDGKRLATSWQKQTALWDVATGVRTHLLPATGELVFSPDGALVAFTSPRGPARSVTAIWDVRPGRAVPSSEIPAVGCRAFSPDGRLLALGCPGGVVQLWEVARARHVLTLRGHTPTMTISSVAFRPDGRRLLSAGGDGLIKVWDLRRLDEVLDRADSR